MPTAAPGMGESAADLHDRGEVGGDGCDEEVNVDMLDIRASVDAHDRVVPLISWSIATRRRISCC